MCLNHPIMDNVLIRLFFIRYNSITRFNADPSRARPRRKSPENGRYSTERKTESVSSSSTASPATPSAPLPRLIHSPFSSDGSLSYDYDSSPWASSSSSPTATDEGSLFNSPVNMSSLDTLGDSRTSLPATPSTDASYQGIDISVNQTLSGLTESPHLVYSDSVALPADSMYSKTYMNNHPPQDTSILYHGGGTQELYQNYPAYPSVYSSELPTHYSMFESLPNQVDPLIGLGWDAATSPLEVKAYNGFKIPPQNEFAVSFIILFE